MSRAKGKVARIGEGKFSKYIMLDNKDGFYFNTKYNPKCGVDDVVGITYTPKGETRGNITKVEILEDAGGPKGVQENARVSSGGGGDRQESIIMQHSQEMALRYVTLLLSAEAIKLPKASDREEFVSTLVDESTVRFNEQATNPQSPVAVESEETKAEKEDEWECDDKETPSDDDW